jgi:hypothetical protein
MILPLRRADFAQVGQLEAAEPVTAAMLQNKARTSGVSSASRQLAAMAPLPPGVIMNGCVGRTPRGGELSGMRHLLDCCVHVVYS